MLDTDSPSSSFIGSLWKGIAFASAIIGDLREIVPKRLRDSHRFEQCHLMISVKIHFDLATKAIYGEISQGDIYWVVLKIDARFRECKLHRTEPRPTLMLCYTIFTGRV